MVRSITAPSLYPEYADDFGETDEPAPTSLSLYDRLGFDFLERDGETVCVPKR